MNIFELPAKIPTSSELVDVLVDTSQVKIERIISSGHHTPPGEWYDQTRAEWVVLLQGYATLAYDDGAVVQLGRGTCEYIPAHRRHRVEWTSADPPCIWLTVHS
jgi:cupin 2 domain-containing protein